MKFSEMIRILLFAAVLAVTACGGSEGGDGGSSTDFTVDENEGDTVTLAEIPGVTVPVRGERPVTTVGETEQYTGTISWQPADTAFGENTIYTATVALVAKTGFTMRGVAADFFTVAGAVATNAPDSGTVTAVFPATGTIPDIDVVFQGAVQTGGSSETTDSTGLTLTFDADPVALTADNITVSGATKGALSGTGTTRSLVISDITAANGGTVTVTITSPSGYAISGSPKTAVVYRAPYIGMPYQGGVIAYFLQSGDPGYVSGETHGLVAATEDQDDGTGIRWTSTNTNITTETALGKGELNTYYIVLNGGPGSHAAKLCDEYSNTNTGSGVYSDWYMPSQDELNKLHQNKAAIGGFSDANYWSSSQYGTSSSMAYYQNFLDGTQDIAAKSDTYRVRAVRSF